MRIATKQIGIQGQRRERVGALIYPSMPTVVAFTSRSAAPGRSIAATPIARASSPRALGRRLQTRDPAPASRSAQTAARAVPPAPSTTAPQARRIGARSPRSGRARRCCRHSSRRRPRTSACWRRRSARGVGRAVGERERRRACGARSRWRRRSPRPAARARSPRSARAGPAAAGRCSRAARARAIAARCIAGERLWRTGQPTHAERRRRRLAAHGQRRRRAAAVGVARGVVGGRLGLELRVAVVANASLPHV